MIYDKLCNANEILLKGQIYITIDSQMWGKVTVIENRRKLSPTVNLTISTNVCEKVAKIYKYILLRV